MGVDAVLHSQHNGSHQQSKRGHPSLQRSQAPVATVATMCAGFQVSKSTAGVRRSLCICLRLSLVSLCLGAACYAPLHCVGGPGRPAAYMGWKGAFK